MLCSSRLNLVALGSLASMHKVSGAAPPASLYPLTLACSLALWLALFLAPQSGHWSPCASSYPRAAINFGLVACFARSRRSAAAVAAACAPFLVDSWLGRVTSFKRSTASGTDFTPASYLSTRKNKIPLESYIYSLWGTLFIPVYQDPGHKFVMRLNMRAYLRGFIISFVGFCVKCFHDFEDCFLITTQGI